MCLCSDGSVGIVCSDDCVGRVHSGSSNESRSNLNTSIYPNPTLIPIITPALTPMLISTLLLTLNPTPSLTISATVTLTLILALSYPNLNTYPIPNTSSNAAITE